MRRKVINVTPIAETINEVLVQRGMIQKELSDLTKITTVTLNECLAGQRSFSPIYIVKIAIVLGLDAIALGRMQSDYEIMQVINPIIENSK